MQRVLSAVAFMVVALATGCSSGGTSAACEKAAKLHDECDTWSKINGEEVRRQCSAEPEAVAEKVACAESTSCYAFMMCQGEFEGAKFVAEVREIWKTRGVDAAFRELVSPPNRSQTTAAVVQLADEVLAAGPIYKDSTCELALRCHPPRGESDKNACASKAKRGIGDIASVIAYCAARR